jgi:hypothetical protein
MEVSGQLHTPANLHPGKEPLTLTVQEAGWAPEPVWMRWWEKFLASTKTRTSIIQPVVQRHIAELTRLLVKLYICFINGFLESITIRTTHPLRYGLDDRGSRVRFPAGLGIFLFTAASRTALGPSQPPIEWVPGALSLGVKLTTHLHLVSRSKNAWSYTSAPPISLNGVVLN